ncbi:12903_t:CDS:2 [Entrophospora sp. SA101]|nr:7874_t:CDS:2 [Entrophospora sp. SA101]CAJ0830442.1 12903_t:CDS:2 [Entrophospora sp. SA101]
MTKHQQFTKLPIDSDVSISNQPHQQAIPLEEISLTEQPVSLNLQSRSSTTIQPHVHFSSISPISSTTPSLHRNSINELGLNEDEWVLTEIPEELKNADTNSANITEANSMQTDWKRKLFLLLEDPSSSNAALIVHVFVSFSIVLSAVLTTIETIPSFRSTSGSVWFNFETTLVVVFTIEYILRFIAHSDSIKQLWQFIKAPLTIIDFIAIVPYYIALGFHHDTTYDFRFTILRLFRLLRVFKAFKYSSTIIMTIEVMIIAVKRSMDALGALFFFMVTSIVLFSTLLYFAERGTWDQEKLTFVDSNGYPSSFDSIPSAFWFVMVTITTTGYGDMLIALPSIIVGRNFTLVWEAMRQYRRSAAGYVRDNHNNPDDNIEDNGSEGYPIGTGMRESFESTQSFASHVNRAYSSLNDEIINNQDTLLQQTRLLMKIFQQNQISLEKIQKTLEQNGINYNPTQEKLEVTPPEKSLTTNSESL